MCRHGLNSFTWFYFFFFFIIIFFLNNLLSREVILPKPSKSFRFYCIFRVFNAWFYSTRYLPPPPAFSSYVLHLIFFLNIFLSHNREKPPQSSEFVRNILLHLPNLPDCRVGDIFLILYPPPHHHAFLPPTRPSQESLAQVLTRHIAITTFGVRCMSQSSISSCPYLTKYGQQVNA